MEKGPQQWFVRGVHLWKRQNPLWAIDDNTTYGPFIVWNGLSFQLPFSDDPDRTEQWFRDWMKRQQEPEPDPRFIKKSKKIPPLVVGHRVCWNHDTGTKRLVIVAKKQDENLFFATDPKDNWKMYNVSADECVIMSGKLFYLPAVNDLVVYRDEIIHKVCRPKLSVHDNDGQLYCAVSTGHVLWSECRLLWRTRIGYIYNEDFVGLPPKVICDFLDQFDEDWRDVWNTLLEQGRSNKLKNDFNVLEIKEAIQNDVAQSPFLPGALACMVREKRDEFPDFYRWMVMDYATELRKKFDDWTSFARFWEQECAQWHHDFNCAHIRFLVQKFGSLLKNPFIYFVKLPHNRDVSLTLIKIFFVTALQMNENSPTF